MAPRRTSNQSSQKSFVVLSDTQAHFPPPVKTAAWCWSPLSKEPKPDCMARLLWLKCCCAVCCCQTRVAKCPFGGLTGIMQICLMSLYSSASLLVKRRMGGELCRLSRMAQQYGTCTGWGTSNIYWQIAFPANSYIKTAAFSNAVESQAVKLFIS